MTDRNTDKQTDKQAQRPIWTVKMTDGRTVGQRDMKTV